MLSNVWKAILHHTRSPFSSVSNSCFSQGKWKSRTRTCDILLSYSSSLQLCSRRDSCCAGSGFFLISYTQWIYFICICPVLSWTCISFWNVKLSEINRKAFFFSYFLPFLFCLCAQFFKESWDVIREVHSQGFKDPMHCESWKHQRNREQTFYIKA